MARPENRLDPLPAPFCAMVGFGLVMLYSASSAVAELRYHVPPYHFVGSPTRLGRRLVPRLDVFQAPRLPRPSQPGVGVLRARDRAGSAGDRVFRGPSRAPLVPFGLGSLQPSEFAKPALILFLAYFVSRRSQAINDKRTLRQAFVAVAMLAVMVVVADLGTALVPVITAVIVFWVAGLEKRYMVRVGGHGAALVVIAMLVARLSRAARIISLFRPGLFKDRDHRHASLGSRLRAAVDHRTRRQLSAASIKIAVGAGRVSASA